MVSRRSKSLLLLILLMVPFFSVFTSIPVKAVGENWLTGWAYRKKITISGSTQILTDYPVKIRVHYGDAPYLTSFTRSANNPIYDTPGQCWFISWYDNNADLVWIFIQDDDASDAGIEAFSFDPVNWDNKTLWTDHGTVYTEVEAWGDVHIEPHGIIYETQAMADARGGAASERQLRIYYCGKPAGTTVEYGVGFINASTSNLTAWTPYASNPVIPKGGFNGYADSKAVIYNDQVWILLAEYPGPDWCYYRNSTDGIVGWSTIRSADYSVRYVMGSLVPLNGSGIGMINNFFGNEGITGVNDTFQFKVTQDGIYTEKYGEPLLVAPDDGGWEDEFRWNSLVIDENGPALIGGYYYLFYAGYDSDPANIQMGVARLDYTTPSDSGSDVWVDKLSESDFSDIRFTSSDGSTLIDQFNLTQMDGVFSDFWVEVPSIATGDTTIYMYYGNSGASDVNDADTTFSFFDGFDRVDNVTVGNGWTEDSTAGTISIVDNTLSITEHAHHYAHVERAFPAIGNFEIVTKVRLTNIAGASWAISVAPYWGPYQWVCTRPHQDANGFIMERDYTGTYNQTVSSVAPDLDIGFWNFLNVTVDQSFIQGNYFKGHHTLNHDSTTIANVTRVASFSGTPNLLILGKGLSRNGGSFPNADWDNDNADAGVEGTQYVDWVLVRQYFSPEPVISAWGAEVPAEVPSITSASIPDMDDTDNCYAMTFYNFTVDVADANGATDIDNVYLRVLQESTVRAEVRATNLTGTPAWAIQTGSTIIDLNTTACSWAEAGDVGTANFSIAFEWDYVAESDLELAVFVEDASSLSAGWTTMQSNYTDVITRLVTQDFVSNMTVGAGNVTIELSGYVRYATTIDGDLSSSSYPPDAQFTSVKILNDDSELMATDAAIVNGFFNTTFNSSATAKTTLYYVWLDLLNDYVDGLAPDGDYVGVTTTDDFWLALLIEQAFSTFGITGYLSAATAYGASLGVYFLDSITNIVQLIVQQFLLILGIFDFFIDWYTRMMSLVTNIGSIVTGLFDGTGTVVWGVGSFWDYISFSTWIDIVPVFLFIWWVESIAKRGTTQGEVTVFLGDMQTVMNVTSWFLSMFGLIINTVTDLAFRLLEVIT